MRLRRPPFFQFWAPFFGAWGGVLLRNLGHVHFPGYKWTRIPGNTGSFPIPLPSNYPQLTYVALLSPLILIISGALLGGDNNSVLLSVAVRVNGLSQVGLYVYTHIQS